MRQLENWSQTKLDLRILKWGTQWDKLLGKLGDMGGLLNQKWVTWVNF